MCGSESKKKTIKERERERKQNNIEKYSKITKLHRSKSCLCCSTWLQIKSNENNKKWKHFHFKIVSFHSVVRVLMDLSIYTSKKRTHKKNRCQFKFRSQSGDELKKEKKRGHLKRQRTLRLKEFNTRNACKDHCKI